LSEKPGVTVLRDGASSVAQEALEAGGVKGGPDRGGYLRPTRGPGTLFSSSCFCMSRSAFGRSPSTGTVRSTTEIPSPVIARPAFALCSTLQRSRKITRSRLERWTRSTAAGRTSAVVRPVLCSSSCALFHQSPVTSLGVAFVGVLSRGVKQFISAVAEMGAVVPERFECCRGSDQARGVIASFARRSFCRTSMSGVCGGAL